MNFKIGLRTIKSAIAVGICVLISHLTGRRDVIFFGGVASVICMQQTNHESLKSGFHRFMGTFLGGALGFFTIMLGSAIPLYSKWLNIFVISLAVFLLIYLCHLCKINESTAVSCIVMLNVTANYNGGSMAGDALKYVVFRVAFTLVGIIVAMLINNFVFPYKGAQPYDSDNNDFEDEGTEKISTSRFIPGLRNIKTALSVLMCVLFSHIIGNEQAIFFCGFAAVMCMNQFHADSLKTGVFLSIGTIYGGVLGLAAMWISNSLPTWAAWLDIALIAIAIYLGIYICNLLNHKDATNITCIIMLKVVSGVYGPTDKISPLVTYLSTVVLFYTIIGIAIAVIINRLVFPQHIKQ